MSRRERFWADHLDEEGFPESEDAAVSTVLESETLSDMPRTQLASDMGEASVINVGWKR